MLGDFVVPAGIAIDALLGNDAIYVAPALPSTLIATTKSSESHDFIWAVERERFAVTPATKAVEGRDYFGVRDAALLQLLNDWLSGAGTETPAPSQRRLGVVKR